MVGMRILLFVVFLFVDCMAQREIAEPKCGKISSTKSSWTVNINSKRNETGDWVTAFSAWRDSRKQSNISLSVSQKVIDCDEKQIVFVHGVLSGGEDDKLVFHRKHGRNIAISNDGRSVKKINSTDLYNGVVLTKRPLRDSELFEVRLDKRVTARWSIWGIGITINAPETIDIPTSIYQNKNISGYWMMYEQDVYQNGTNIFPNYVSDIDDLKEGDRIGVMRNNYGALHFFVNGVDKGPAASNIPYPVYGVFELYYKGLGGTIVDIHMK